MESTEESIEKRKLCVSSCTEPPVGQTDSQSVSSGFRWGKKDAACRKPKRRKWQNISALLTHLGLLGLMCVKQMQTHTQWFSSHCDPVHLWLICVYPQIMYSRLPYAACLSVHVNVNQMEGLSGGLGVECFQDWLNIYQWQEYVGRDCSLHDELFDLWASVERCEAGESGNGIVRAA